MTMLSIKVTCSLSEFLTSAGGNSVINLTNGMNACIGEVVLSMSDPNASVFHQNSEIRTRPENGFNFVTELVPDTSKLAPISTENHQISGNISGLHEVSVQTDECTRFPTPITCVQSAQPESSLQSTSNDNSRSGVTATASSSSTNSQSTSSRHCSVETANVITVADEHVLQADTTSAETRKGVATYTSNSASSPIRAVPFAPPDNADVFIVERDPSTHSPKRSCSSTQLFFHQSPIAKRARDSVTETPTNGNHAFTSVRDMQVDTLAQADTSRDSGIYDCRLENKPRLQRPHPDSFLSCYSCSMCKLVFLDVEALQHHTSAQHRLHPNGTFHDSPTYSGSRSATVSHDFSSSRAIIAPSSGLLMNNRRVFGSVENTPVRPNEQVVGSTPSPYTQRGFPAFSSISPTSLIPRDRIIFSPIANYRFDSNQFVASTPENSSHPVFGFNSDPGLPRPRMPDIRPVLSSDFSGVSGERNVFTLPCSSRSLPVGNMSTNNVSNGPTCSIPDRMPTAACLPPALFQTPALFQPPVSQPMTSRSAVPFAQSPPLQFTNRNSSTETSARQNFHAKPFVCTSCFRFFSTENKLDKHVCREAGERTKFSRKRKLYDVNQSTSHDSSTRINNKGNRNMKCENCDASFVDNDSFTSHLSSCSVETNAESVCAPPSLEFHSLVPSDHSPSSTGLELEDSHVSTETSISEVVPATSVPLTTSIPVSPEVVTPPVPRANSVCSEGGGGFTKRVLSPVSTVNEQSQPASDMSAPVFSKPLVPAEIEALPKNAEVAQEDNTHESTVNDDERETGSFTGQLIDLACDIISSNQLAVSSAAVAVVVDASSPDHQEVCMSEPSSVNLYSGLSNAEEPVGGFEDFGEPPSNELELISSFNSSIFSVKSESSLS